MTSKRPMQLIKSVLMLVLIANSVAASPMEIVTNNNKFALELYTQLETNSNLFFSPYSISTAMAMTYAGAKGNTAKQIAQVLHFSNQNLHENFMHLQSQINHQQLNLELKMANTLCGQQGYNFTDDFKTKLKKFYQTELQEADFITAHEQVRTKINNWVEKQTTIKKLIKPGIINNLTRLVLVNAVYFKGQWLTKFTKTTQAKFWLNTNNNVNVVMMYQKGKFSYLNNRTVQILELPYLGEISMLIILPKHNLTQVENLLAKRLHKWLTHLRPQPVKIYLPKFKINASLELAKTLSTMGIYDAFKSGEADFSGIDGTKRNLYLSAVIHQAFIEIDETGTEAAAATGVTFNTRGVAPAIPKFRADHPFIFLIRHNPSDSILFMGRVINPN